MLGGHAAANATGSITLSGVEQVKDIPGQRYCFDLGARGCRAGDCSGRLRIYGYSDAGKLLKEWVSPGGTGSGPYGIAVTKGGEVWYSESGVKPNTLVKFDPKRRASIRSRSHPAAAWFAIWSQLPIGGFIWPVVE
jgi:hypothetical protein